MLLDGRRSGQIPERCNPPNSTARSGLQQGRQENPASARCRLVNRIPHENRCNIVREKAGFILRGDLEAGSQYFCCRFFRMSGS
jgi:hypothetical protein